MRLSSELHIEIASYLPPRGIFAMLIAFPALPHVLLAIDNNYTREQRVFENNTEDCQYRMYTPLQYFCSRGAERIVQRLLSTGADPNEISFDPTKNQIPPLVHAIGFRSACLVSLLLQHGAWVDDRHDPETDSVSLHYLYRMESPLHVAVGPPNRILPRINDQDVYRERAGEILPIVKLLLGEGADVNAVDGQRDTPLQTACATIGVDSGIVQALISAGSDISRRASLHLSVPRVLTVDPAVPRLLRSRFRRMEDSGVALLHHAANTGNTAVLRVLLDAEADVDVVTRVGMRALDLAVLHMRRDVVELLVQAGADVSAGVTDGSGQVVRLDPFQVVEETATWDQLLEWLRVRGCRLRGNSLSEWRAQAELPGTSSKRAGQP